MDVPIGYMFKNHKGYQNVVEMHLITASNSEKAVI